MIKKLRIKIVLVITVLLTIVIAILMLAINIIARNNSSEQTKDRLQTIADSDGTISPTQINPYHGNQMGYIDNFSVLLGMDNEVLKITLNRNIIVQQTDIVSYVNEALASGKSVGTIGSYAYMIQPKSYGKIVVFLDVSVQQLQNDNLVVTTIMIGIVATIIFFIIAVILSFWLVKPVKETFDKQKLFISNASHELKTPLAVISANTDVLEAELGENKWLSYIRSESVRMSELVNELLCLARLDDKSGHRLVMSELNLTDIVLQTALPFESTVFEMGKKFDVEAEPNVKFVGDESSIKHVLTILIDNAIKYSNEKGEVSVKLYTHSGKKIIEVYNTGDGIPSDKLNKVFERFYRQDEARNSKSGGYGLGLAIAKSIVEAHNGKICAKSEYGKWAKFIVTFPSSFISL